VSKAAHFFQVSVYMTKKLSITLKKKLHFIKAGNEKKHLHQYLPKLVCFIQLKARQSHSVEEKLT
jgi:hypothetical protein